MDATYAYYLSATFIPPGKPETFAYFGMEPEAYLGLHVEGRVIAQTQTDRKKIIDTLTYPGLAVKGIAAVGPTLNIRGKIVAGKTLMNAQLSGYVNTDLSFQAHGDYDTSDNAFHYRFGAYLYYNIGYKAVAKILSFVDWATGDRKAYSPDKMLKLYEKTGTIPMSESDMGKRGLPIEADAQEHEITADLSKNSTMSVLETAADIFRRADVTTLDPKIPEFTKPGASSSGYPNCDVINCGFLGPYQAVNEILDKDGDLQERLTHDVPGLCDNILNLAPLRSKFTFSQGEKRIDARLRRKGLQLECDEFPWASSEQGGKWLPESQRRIECVTRVQNGWHGNCVKLVGGLSSNWKQLDPESRGDPKKIDYWVSWQKQTDWTRPNNYGIGENRPYEQKLVEYGEEMPPPDGGDQAGNTKMSWAFKRNYETSWLMPGKSLTSADWWNANKPTWYKTSYDGPLTMDSVLCAVNHFNQDNTYKLPGTKVTSSGKILGEQKEYNAFCKRTNSIGMRPSAWNIEYNMAYCLIRFQDSGSSSSDTSKRDEKWGEWGIESIEYVADVDDADVDRLLDESEENGWP
ncbi:hypothetical protein PENFLA_c093G00176 [Penicillium flavigenum]|uniref:Uncharacterized protein n=1 Tax=Penicillium flavigenum TaxID=254877 RepID=A0A1V6S8P6_9EURO|nr:hypothetical protein PENFLA_c093G00176 [Penicillium flavigenum]